MITINNNDDLRIAYTILNWTEKENRNNKSLPRFKRSIREYLKRMDHSDRRIIKDDSYGYIELVTLPDFIESFNDADEWFAANEYIKPYYTYYDCTGKPFTSWYKVFKRNGRWMVYHSVGYDV